MFLTEDKIKKAVREVLYDGGTGRQKIEELNKEIEKLKVEKMDLELKKRIEEEEIKHLVKMKEEKILIDTQKKEIELQRQYNQREMDLQSKYHESIVKAIEEQRKESKELYTKIMDRLPNVNVNMDR